MEFLRAKAQYAIWQQQHVMLDKALHQRKPSFISSYKDKEVTGLLQALKFNIEARQPMQYKVLKALKDAAKNAIPGEKELLRKCIGEFERYIDYDLKVHEYLHAVESVDPKNIIGHQGVSEIALQKCEPLKGVKRLHKAVLWELYYQKKVKQALGHLRLFAHTNMNHHNHETLALLYFIDVISYQDFQRAQRAA